MEQENFNQTMEVKKLPTGLNVLTILTFIGSAIGLIFSITGYLNAQKNLTEMEKLMNDSEKMAQIPDFMKSMFSPEAVELIRLQVVYKTPLLILGLIGIVLCVMGALQMRKLKMQGYFLWLIGEILPVIGFIIFIGVGSFKGFMGILMICILVLFILLYTLQRKHLKN